MTTSPGKGSNAATNPNSFTRPRNVSLSNSDSSDSSSFTNLPTHKRNPYATQQAHPSPLGAHANPSASSLANFSRPQTARVVVNEASPRQHSPSTEVAPSFASAAPYLSQAGGGHRRQRSQGYFEPTLPSASAIGNANANANNTHAMSNLNTSQIAAQAAMQGRVDPNNPSHMRKRSMTLPDPNDKGGKGGQRKQSAPSPPPVPSFNVSMNRAHVGDGFSGGHKLAAATAATTAANAAFPRSPQFSPSYPPTEHGGMGAFPGVGSQQAAPEKEVKPGKEKSKMKLFSKPKSIGIIKEKDVDKKYALPSPNKLGMNSTMTLPRFANASTTSLADPTASSASSLYSSANASTSTLVPSVSMETKEKEKHSKHNFLSRQKNKLKDKDHDIFNLPLSSSSSTSRPTDPNAPQPLYSFAAPSSPGHSSSFAKSVSGLDLRHGGRALREKKKEEKAAAQSLLAPVASSGMSILSDGHSFRERDPSFSIDRSEWPGPGSLGGLGSSMASPTPSNINPADFIIPQPAVTHLANAFNLPGMGPDDAWPLLKARLLFIFEGEEPRQPVEDFNSLVGVWIRRCVQLGRPTTVIDDLDELLQTGFASLDQTLRPIPDERLVPCLVDLWHQVFSTVLPYLQAVFLPLDLEFKGRGSIMSVQEASEIWGARLPTALAMDSRSISQDRPGTAEMNREPSPVNPNIPTLGEDLDVRRKTLLAYRDVVILPRIEKLLGIFSRLSLENLSAGFGGDTSPLPEPPSLAALAGGMGRDGTNSRPSTAPSADPSSYSSTNILESSLSSTSGFGARSRATSNTSAGSFQSIPGVLSPPTPSATANVISHGHSNSLHGYLPTQPPPMDSAKVTEIVGRMLQCVSVLAGVQTGDEHQESMERLAREMKLNWLGRGRTGRQRRGFVGTKMPRQGIGLAGTERAGMGGIEVR